MSETVHYTGKLIYQEKNSPTDTIEEQCKRILNSEELKSYNDTYVEQLMDTHYKEYVIHDDKLYRVDGLVARDEDEDIFRMKKINGNDFEFEVRYYNGGCGFEEAIDYAFEELK